MLFRSVVAGEHAAEHHEVRAGAEGLAHVPGAGAPAVGHDAAAESVRTMQFAMQVKSIQNRPVVQLDPQEKLILELRNEVEALREENAQLLGEKSALTDAVKSLNKEVSKLKNFKMNLMATLKDDDQVEFANEASGDRLVSSVLQSAKPTASPRQTSGSMMSDRTGAYGSTPVASPARFGSQNQNGSRSHSSTLTSPSVTGSPGGFGGKVDGKEFFRQARARLSYEKFSQFLSNIKELNAHKQTRQETLARASEIFGDANADL